MLFDTNDPVGQVALILAGLVLATLGTIVLVQRIKERIKEGPPIMRRCGHRGREGTRGFRVLPPSTMDIGGQAYTLPEFTVCEAQEACWRRRSNRHATYDD
jgi:hypothetical protein